jgi:hypothetical protein
VLVIPAAAAAQDEPATISNYDVAQMVRDGLPDSAIVLVILGGPTDFDVSETSIRALRNSGVSEQIVGIMRGQGWVESSDLIRSGSNSPNVAVPERGQRWIEFPDLSPSVSNSPSVAVREFHVIHDHPWSDRGGPLRISSAGLEYTEIDNSKDSFSVTCGDVVYVEAFGPYLLGGLAKVTPTVRLRLRNQDRKWYDFIGHDRPDLDQIADAVSLACGVEKK